MWDVVVAGQAELVRVVDQSHRRVLQAQVHQKKSLCVSMAVRGTIYSCCLPSSDDALNPIPQA